MNKATSSFSLFLSLLLSHIFLTPLLSTKQQELSIRTIFLIPSLFQLGITYPSYILMNSTRRGGITYWVAEHPAIVGFRWSHFQSWGSTWVFLVSSLTIYALLAVALRLALRLVGRRRPVPLGPLPAVHSLLMALSSAAIFLGLLLSAVAEIRDVRWSWRRSKTTALQWLICFPPGTRSAGRVFFWSYAFYLSRFLHLLRTFLDILRRRRRALVGVFRHCALVCMSFLWLEFSQSLQVVAILSATLARAVVFGYRFWVSVGLPAGAGDGVASACLAAVVACDVACHLGVLLLHFVKGGCSGIGAWGFNSVLNAALLVLFVDCYIKNARRRRGEAFEGDGVSSHGCGRHREAEYSEVTKLQ